MEQDEIGQQEAARQNLPTSPSSCGPTDLLHMTAALVTNTDPGTSSSAVAVSTTALVVADIMNDGMFVALWLHGRGPHTIRAYRFEIEKFRRHIFPAEIRALRLKEIQNYLDTLAALSPNSQRRAYAALKSLFSFGVRVGYLSVNMGLFLRPVSARDTLSERILDEPVVYAIIARETRPRDRLMLRLLYAAGLRVSEICALKWRDIQERSGSGQITIFGKGGKTRTILLSASTFGELQAFGKVWASSPTPEAPVFPSRKGSGHLHPSQVLRIVKRATRAADAGQGVSPHWFRHAHASHALERGCPIHLVQATLGHASVSTTGRYLHARPGDSSARYLGV